MPVFSTWIWQIYQYLSFNLLYVDKKKKSIFKAQRLLSFPNTFLINLMYYNLPSLGLQNPEYCETFAMCSRTFECYRVLSHTLI